MNIRFLASSQIFYCSPRLRSVTVLYSKVGRGGKCGFAEFSSPHLINLNPEAERSRGHLIQLA